MTRPLDARASGPLAVATRSGFPESVHLGAAVVMDADGVELHRIGDPGRLLYPRSALKPFQTVAARRAGARFSTEQAVIVSSSHAGTPRHIALVREVLATAGLDEAALQTPESWPSSAEAARDRVREGLGPARIAMNCSGNHAGMLAGSVAAGWSVDDYLGPAHPIHALAATVIAEYGRARAAHQGVDGCGGPVWAIPLTALADGYRRLCADDAALAAAVRAFPDLVEGSGTPTTRAIATLDVVAKSGAAGVFAAVALLAASDAVDGDAADAFLDDPALAVTGGGVPVGRIRVLGR